MYPELLHFPWDVIESEVIPLQNLWLFVYLQVKTYILLLRFSRFIAIVKFLNWFFDILVIFNIFEVEYEKNCPFLLALHMLINKSLDASRIKIWFYCLWI